MRKRKEYDQSFWSFDTEDNSRGRVYWINFFNGQTHVSFDSREKAVPWILDQEGEFWAVNLEYDLINLFGDLLEPLTVLTYGGFGLIKATIYGKSVRFFNTLRHWPLSVEEMGERLGFPKLPFDPTNLTYCQRDCEVTWRFIDHMIARYKELGIEEISATLPSTALKFFLHKFCLAEYARHPDSELWNFLSESRYGGRCEVFYTRPVHQTLHEYDINSSYPAVMKSEKFPKLDTARDHPATIRLEREGVARVSVRVPSTRFPVLPWKHPKSGKLLFPVGRFCGTWAYPELRLAVEEGTVIERWEHAVEYDAMASPFISYIDFLYRKRMEVKTIDPLMAYTLKILMNATFGKFGERGEITILSRGMKHERSHMPKHSNMIWSTYILAYGRIALFHYLKEADKKGDVLYCDTDSVFVKCDQPPFEGSSELGKLAHKGTYRYAHFKLPKLYHLEDQYKAKGVPLDKQRKKDMQHLKREFFNEEIAEFLKPYRLMEARRLKEMPNVWRTVAKQLQSTYDKRWIHADGRTWPITLS